MSGTEACVVFLTGEGPNDIGPFANEPMHQRPPSGRRKRAAPPDGFIPPILRRIAKEVDVEIRIEGRKITHLPKAPRGRITPPRAADERAHRARALAETYDARVIVFLKDADRYDRDAMMTAILTGLEGDGDSAYAPALLVGVVERMIEAWALGDPGPIAEHAGGDAATVPSRPEELWGDKHDPSSGYPKHVLRRCLGRKPGQRYTTEELGTMAENANLDLIARRCPRSFKPFLDQARAIAAQCSPQTTR